MAQEKGNAMQFNVQADPEFIEDMKVVASRRGQSMSEFIRRAVEAELQKEAMIQVP